MTDLNHRMNRAGWLTLWVLSVLWGGSFFFAGVQIKALPPPKGPRLTAGRAEYVAPRTETEKALAATPSS